MGRPTLIIVTGPAGSGKTTLAHELARAVGCPALSRDEIKEGLVRSSPGFVASPDDPLDLRTYEVFFAAITLLLEAGVTLVVEAAFQHPLWSRGLEPLTGMATLRVLHCQVAEDVARGRQQDRLATQPTRAAHADADHLSTRRSFDAIRLEVPTLDVDTTDQWHPGLEAIARFCVG